MSFLYNYDYVNKLLISCGKFLNFYYPFSEQLIIKIMFGFIYKPKALNFLKKLLNFMVDSFTFHVSLNSLTDYFLFYFSILICMVLLYDISLLYVLGHVLGQGGGVIQGTASEAVLVVLLAARDRVLRKVGKDAIGKLVVYASDQTHSAMQKACQVFFETQNLSELHPTC